MSDEQKPVDSRNEILDLLKDLQSHYGTYHNHKENLGWAGVVLFTFIIAGIANTLQQHSPQTDLSFIVRGVVSLVVIGVCAVFSFYVHKQFALRQSAADYVAACVHLRSQIVSDPSMSLKPAEWAPPKDPAVSGMQSTHVLPQALLGSAGQLKSVGQNSRGLLEFYAYAILVGLTISLLIAIWLGANKPMNRTAASVAATPSAPGPQLPVKGGVSSE